MIRQILKVLSVIFAVLVTHKVQCQAPPKITDSYIAWGEITQPIKELAGAEMQVAFEETYDATNQNAAFVVWLAGKNVTFVKNYKTNQTFSYSDGKDCRQTDETEWVASDYPPGLMTYEDDDGTVKFSLRQFFNLPDKYLATKAKQGIKAVFRGIPAKRWMYEIVGKVGIYKRKLVIYSFWSDGSWNTSSNAATVPLGFIVDKTFYYRNVTVEETVTNVFGFISGAYDHKYFEPFQGIICANRTQTLKFPSLQNIKALSFHSEMVLPDYQEIKYIDTWFDPKSQIVRVDVERLREEDVIAERKEKRYESETAIGKMGIVYRLNYFKGQINCEIIPFAKYENDMQNFIDVKQDLKKWTIGKLFGLNDTNYVYTGKTTKANIPCHVFQGIRKDWPEESAKVTSLWEWCFNVNMTKEYEAVLFRNDELGLISAQVTILTSEKPQDYPPGFRMFHHFYEVSAKDPAILDSTNFDITRCYSYPQRRYLQFYLDREINDDNIFTFENFTSDVTFLQRWKEAIYKHAGLPDYSLRISNVKSTIADKKLYIRFVILAVHDKLPDDIKRQQKSAQKAESDLRDKVNEGKVSILYFLKKGAAPEELKAAKHSVTFQMNPQFEPHTLPPVPTTTPTESTTYRLIITTDPDTDDKSGSTGSSKPPTGKPDTKGKDNVTRHTPGTVATVSIAMLLVGFSIGCGSTFYKFYGLPSCLRS